MRRAWVVGVAAGVFVLGSFWYVQAPPRTVGDYRERAALTVETLRSQVESARLWVQALEEERTLRPTALVGLREADEDASTAAAEFAGWDPRGDTRRLRSQIATLAAEVTDALGALRVEAEDGQWDALPELAAPLPRLSDRLQALAEQADR
jgi:hypothetical protein